jgi:predicted adenine nucleotide alpha hydrolase (AANH) superfamily ATPase
MKVMLHICCGVCAAGAVERLSSEGHTVIGLFYNPNIHPAEEYSRRLEVAKQVAAELDFPLIVPPYEPGEWLQEAETLADEPEGGRRCEVCFQLRLHKAHDFMVERQADVFTTTLTIGPRKSADVINRIGREIDDERFLVRDFKKKAGFQRAIDLAKQWELYRQDYCGCLYSRRSK